MVCPRRKRIFMARDRLTALALAALLALLPIPALAGAGPDPASEKPERKLVIYENLRDLNFEFLPPLEKDEE